jgi:citronellol/citronellal dehydrogenase
MNYFKNTISVISGGSRGIGKQMAIELAKKGSSVFIIGKTLNSNDSKLEGSLEETTKEIKSFGGSCEPVKLDLRNRDDINNKISLLPNKIDILINNASAITRDDTTIITSKKYNLINEVNSQGTFFLTKNMIPKLKNSSNPRVLTISPNIHFDKEWFKIAGVPYTISKMNMSMYSLGWSEEFKNQIAFNCLWPKRIVKTDAIKLLIGDKGLHLARDPKIMSDAMIKVLENNVDYSGNFLIDEEVLTEAGVDIKQYGNTKAMIDYYVDSPGMLMSNLSKLL